MSGIWYIRDYTTANVDIDVAGRIKAPYHPARLKVLHSVDDNGNVSRVIDFQVEQILGRITWTRRN